MGRKTKMKKEKKKPENHHSNNLMKEKVSENNSWSKLCPDLLRTILESFSSLEFHRAKTVCSNWYSVWKTCVRPLCSWQITYQGDSSMLFDPEKDESYKTNLIGLYGKIYCIASYGNWFPLVDSSLNIRIVNLLTRKVIKLPLIRDSQAHNDIERYKSSAVLWINESTEEYSAAMILLPSHLFVHKSGDKWKWKHNNNGCLFDIAYKNSKLYLYASNHQIKIFDFSRGYLKVEDGRKNPYLNHPFHFVEQPSEYLWRRRIAIRDSGEVLIVLSLKEVIHNEEELLFYVFKMNFESEEWERVYSIGDDEMLIFGHGVTIKAPVQDVGDGIKSNTICFADNDIWHNSDRPSNCGIFNLATSRITWPKRFGAYIDQTRWFVQGSV